MKVKKAVIPAAGLGTRMLPISKTIPKEMLPVLDKPVIHYIVEEAINSGIEDILIITNRGKTAMDDYFDYAPDLEEKLTRSGKDLRVVREMADMANIFCIRQKETKGVGHAIRRAKAFVGGEPFAVLLGDDIIRAKTPVVQQLIDAAVKYDASCVGGQWVSDEVIHLYSSMKVECLEESIYRVENLNEKPTPEEKFSNFAILGRYVFTADIFDAIDRTPPGKGGEIQITDAIRELCQAHPVVAKDFAGRRYDTGNLVGYLEAILEFAQNHPETKPFLAEWIEKTK